MSLHGDFRECIELLIAHRVRFLIVGAQALAVHGRPRFTGDLDIWIARDRENAERLVEALAEFGFDGLDPASFTEFDRLATLGREPVRIDIFTHIPGPEFEHAWDNRIEVDVGSVQAPFIGKEDYVLSKQASGRPKDLIDLELLREAGESHEK